MTSTEIKATVYKQFALDFNCSEDDFVNKKTIFTIPCEKDGARKSAPERPFLELTDIYGTAVFNADKSIMPWLKENFSEYNPDFLSDFSVLRKIDEKLAQFGHEIKNSYISFLPSPYISRIKPDFTCVRYNKDQINRFRGDDRFVTSFEFDPEHPDIIGMGAFNSSGQIMGAAGASADGDYMWHIRMTTVPEFEGKGIAKTLVNNLALEILKHGKLPYCTTRSSHPISAAALVKAHFLPAWFSVVSQKKADGENLK